MLYNKKVPISESALLVIDVQDSFKLGERWSRRNNQDFERNVSRLVDLFRQHGLPVIYFLHSDDDPGFARSGPHYKLMDFLSPLKSEPILHKETRNVFTSTGLPALLLEKGIRRVVITGIQMEQCCETSARVAADMGYAVDFVTEGTMTFPIPNHDTPGRELGVDEIRERTEYALRRRFATIATVDSIAKELGETHASNTAVSEAENPMYEERCTICTDKSRFDLGIIHSFLMNCYWAQGIPQELVRRSIEDALCFGVFDGNKQVGFARVITDRATYAYIGDVFILESHRGRGLAKQLMKAIMEYPELQGLRRWSLVTRDAHGLYEQFGFKQLANPQMYMELVDTDAYKNAHRQHSVSH